ncbi:putative RNA-directed DNA polymerase, eukaryota, reverse transcriptase zinc-binding domain protein [Tanacetum coccineum]
MMVNGLWCEDPSAIKAEMVRHYKILFFERNSIRPLFCCEQVEKILVDDAASLEKEFSKEEIVDAIKRRVRLASTSKRVKKAMGNVVGDVQNAFIKGRFILDGVLIANKTVDYLKKNRSKGLIFKVDFEKAYDSLNWRFLIDKMNKMGLEKDGANGGVLLRKRGKTRRPSFPFLFILAAEGLNAIVKEAVVKGVFKGVKVGSNNVVFSHLQYADDTIFFGEWNKQNAKVLMYILKCFEEVSGLRVNYNKSKLYGVGVSDSELRDMARWMRCSVGDFPFTYLGLPIGDNMRRVDAWNSMIEKFKNRLAEWKAKSMSFGGRLTLVKSVLGSLPLYYFLMFRVPLSVIKQLERVRKNFFWGGLEECKKLAWVKWDTLLTSHRDGGLNIGVTKSIHGVSGGLGSGREWGVHKRGSGIWRDIVTVGVDLEGLGLDFSSSFEGEVGNGRDIRFWIDKWVGGVKLCDRFPRLYHLDRRKEGMVADKGNWVDGAWCWKWEWVRDLRGRACKEFEDFQILFQNVVIMFDCRDRWRWTLHKSGDVIVKELTKLVEEKILDVNNGGDATIWNKWVPKKVNIFVWRALKGRLPVHEELDKRGIDLDSILCPSCGDIVESCSHCLVMCNFAMSVWEKIFNWWKIGNVNAFSIKEFFYSNGNANIPNRSSRLLEVKSQKEKGVELATMVF